VAQKFRHQKRDRGDRGAGCRLRRHVRLPQKVS
jgi:hypothetical protein